MEFQRDIPLAPYTSLKIGGPAEYFFEARDIEGLRAALEQAQRLGLAVTFLGGGSNVLIADRGLRGLMVHLALRGIRQEGSRLIAGAGTPMSDLVAKSAAAGLAGLSWAGGLPGTVGGAIFGNAGTFGHAIGDVAEEVKTLGPDGASRAFAHAPVPLSGTVRGSAPRNLVRQGATAGRPWSFTKDECRFGYRTSRFKEALRDSAIVEAVFALAPGDPEAIQREVLEAVRFRNEHHPAPSSAGSFFKNPDTRFPIEVRPPRAFASSERATAPRRREVGPQKGTVPPWGDSPPREWFGRAPAGWLIDQAGGKGMRVGGAMVSEKHANFIVNVGGATAADVRELAQRVKERVREKFGIELEEEVRILPAP